MIIVVALLVVGAFSCFGKAVWDAGALGRQKGTERREWEATQREREL